MGTPFSKIGGNPIVLGLDGLKDEVKAGLNTPDEFPALAAGSSRALLGDPETASWMQRTTAADGAALIESVKGNTLRWNQLFNVAPTSSTSNGVTFTIEDGSIVANGTATGLAIRNTAGQLTANHKYLYKGCPSGGSLSTYYAYVSGPDPSFTQRDTGNGVFFTAPSSGTTNMIVTITSGNTASNLKFTMQLFDLTAMFGAGNEPATVAEFESLFPNTYYPYDPGSLLPVRMEGVETVGFNQWDEEYLYGQYDGYTGEYAANTRRLCSKYPISIAPNTEYYTYTNASKYNSWINVVYYDANMNHLSYATPYANRTFTTPANARYMHFNTSDDWGGATYNHDICINISDPARNGTYEPHWRSERAIPASTYFPDGMKGIGDKCDALYKDHYETVIGEVDLGTLTWSNPATGVFNAVVSDMATSVAYKVTSAAHAYATNNFNWASVGSYADKSISTAGNDYIYVKDTAYTDAATFKAAMSGVMLHYALATPTTTPIDPPLNLTYRAESGGTERITHTEQSAPPVLSIAYGHTAEGIVAQAASAIAAQDGPTATANHAIGSYLTMGGTLYRVTTAIATGEAITPGTNVTATTVMAEVLSLIQ